MSVKKNQAIYTRGPIGRTMMKTAFAMVAGTLAMSGYNIADTYFVSRRSELTPLPQTMRRFPAPDTLPVLFEAGGNGAVNNLLFGEGGVDSCHLLSHTVRIAALVFVQ